jgi:hypothetical protein
VGISTKFGYIHSKWSAMRCKIHDCGASWHDGYYIKRYEGRKAFWAVALCSVD